MNQRSRNRSRNPAMPFGQLVQRRNGRRIAQHHGDLAATGDAFRLALGSGLSHGSMRRVPGVMTAHGFRALVRHFAAGPAGERLAVDPHKECAVRFFSDGDRRADVAELFNTLGFHGLLQSGDIPPMYESYRLLVTVSSTIFDASQQRIPA